MTFNTFMTLVMLAIFVGLVATASGYPANARFMPFVVGIPAIGLCLLQLLLDYRRARAGPQVEARRETAFPVSGPGAEALLAAVPEPDLDPREIVRREIALWGWFLGFIGGILLFGFWVSIPVFLVAFLRFQARASWRLTLILSAAATLVLYLAVAQAFRIELHRGFVTEFVSDRLGGPS